jgi:hypothetical protein
MARLKCWQIFRRSRQLVGDLGHRAGLVQHGEAAGGGADPAQPCLQVDHLEDGVAEVEQHGLDRGHGRGRRGVAGAVGARCFEKGAYHGEGSSGSTVSTGTPRSRMAASSASGVPVSVMTVW